MDTQPPIDLKPVPETPPTVCYVLYGSAAAVAVIAVVGTFIALAEISRLPSEIPGTWRMVLGVIAILVCGLAAAAVIVGLAEVLRLLGRADATLTRLDLAGPPPLVGAPAPPPSQPSPAPPPSAPALDSRQFEVLQRLLEEVRDNVLLTDEERRIKHQRLAALERRERTVQIQQAVDAGQFQRARQLLLDLERRIGGDENTRVLAEHIETAARQAEAEDVAAATKQCEDLMALTSWDRAARVAEELIDRHPDSLPAKQLLARVHRERQVHQQEHRNRLFLEIQRHTSRREWRQAVEVARRLIETYPESIEAESLRTQMDTLTANAEIEHRKQLEAQYKAYLEENRFADALALAREVIRLYPQSPQARALREQIPHLERHVQASIGKPPSERS